jgi:hypothetical protein
MTNAAPRSRPILILLTFASAAVIGLLVWACWPRSQGSEAGLPAVMRWGGDASGGEPYIIETGRKGEQPAGFEGDLARYLADKTWSEK